ncbi:uncharacterized protein [Chironomus tepperi]|uniref:uncharacterized protein isoform X2 n=1 Tax=Chironomus tepperi TaxID=113505 RepID=UPI00391F7E10
MNKPNQVFNNYYNGASLRTKSYFRDIQETSSSSLIYTNHNHLRATASNLVTSVTDNGICDGMNNCHLTETWENYINQHANLPLSQISSHIPILNSYIPIHSTSLELQNSPYINSYHLNQHINPHHNHQNYYFYKNYLESIYTSFNHYKYVNMSEESKSDTHPQQYLMRDGFSRRNELDYVQTKSEDPYEKNDKTPSNDDNNTNAIEPDFNQKAKTCIKFQDRNKKLDFKVNFRDENRKVNGCFYDSESISPGSRESTMDVSFAPPKKKWLKTHYLTSKSDDLKPVETVSSPSPSLVVISRPTVNFNPQSVSIDLSKSTGNPIPLSTLSNGTNSITIYNIDESQTSLNLSTESSGYVSNSTTSSLGNVSLNQSVTNGDEMEVDIKTTTVPTTTPTTLILDQRIPALQTQTFSALPMPQSSSSSSSAGRRRTISSNSNSSALRSPSTVRAGTREVHNKLEKNRRAHLKECFEALKRQLPVTADEKKTSNLSILGAAIRHIQFLKRKEREYEHEMERLAKEKIAAQNRILFLKRELAQWDVDFSKILPEQTDINAVKSERSESESSIKSGMLYNPSTSLSTINASSSPSNASATNLSTNILNGSSISPPPRITTVVNSPAINLVTPLALTTKDEAPSPTNLSINPVKISAKPSLTNSSIPTSLVGNGSSIPATLSLKTSDSPVCQTMPLNLNANASISTIPQPLNGLKNGFKTYNSKETKGNKSSSPIITNLPSVPACITPTQLTNSSLNSKIDQNDPPTKLIKLINGSAILAPVDKDNKMIHSGQLTLQQVVGGSGLVVSPTIQLLTSPQGFKVINQPNGLTTIELSPQINGQQSTIQQQHRPTHQNSQPGNLQKLLLNGNGTSTTNINTISIPTLTQHTNGGGNHRLAPGGAELNLLPSNSTTSNGAIYRNQGKLIVKETNNSSRVHVVQSTPALVVTQPQNNTTMTHIITSSSQLAGKMLHQQPTAQQYLSATTVKPMLVVNQNGNGSPISEAGKN